MLWFALVCFVFLWFSFIRLGLACFGLFCFVMLCLVWLIKNGHLLPVVCHDVQLAALNDVHLLPHVPLSAHIVARREHLQSVQWSLDLKNPDTDPDFSTVALESEPQKVQTWKICVSWKEAIGWRDFDNFTEATVLNWRLCFETAENFCKFRSVLEF